MLISSLRFGLDPGSRRKIEAAMNGQDSSSDALEEHLKTLFADYKDKNEQVQHERTEKREVLETAQRQKLHEEILRLIATATTPEHLRLIANYVVKNAKYYPVVPKLESEFTFAFTSRYPKNLGIPQITPEAPQEEIKTQRVRIGFHNDPGPYTDGSKKTSTFGFTALA